MVEYLELFKGDDTDFSLNQAICIKLVTDYDLAGCTAHVKFYDYEQTFYPIVDKKLPLSFPGSVTSKFPLGRGSAKIWLTEPDPEGSGTRRRTVANDLKILVTNNIDLLSRKDISYTMLLRYDYKDLDSKPMLNGKVIEGDHTDDYYGIKGPKPDTELSEESENAVQNKVIAVKFKEAEEQIANLVQAEERRATGREQELQNEIDTEVDRATKEETRLQELINAINTFEVVVANSLPIPSEQYSKKLYLIPATNPEKRNVKDEFICVKIEDAWDWEHVGSTAITIEFDNEPTEGSQKVARSGGIWSWVKSILPKWLTSDYAEPATVASVSEKANLAALALEYSPSSAYSVGTIVYHDGNIYQCTTAIADGGEPWNAEHWELRKLDDFFTESNSLLTSRVNALIYEKVGNVNAVLAAALDGTEVA